MIANLSSTMNVPAPSSSSTGGGDKTLLIAGILLGSYLLYKFVIKPEMDRQKALKYENRNDGGLE